MKKVLIVLGLFIAFSSFTVLKIKGIATDCQSQQQEDNVKIKKKKKEITFKPQKVKNEIIFSEETDYEIYDMYGNIILKGKASSVDTSGLTSGVYYINYGGKTGETFVKK